MPFRWTDGMLKDYLAARHMRQMAQSVHAAMLRTPKRHKFGAVKTTRYADAIAFQCKALGLPMPVAEFRFHTERRWQFDFAWPDRFIALEVEGIVYPKVKGEYRAGGRHASVKGLTEDITKYGEAFRLGWKVLRCLPAHVTSGQALLWAEPMLRQA
jgi:hypothetical protein